MMRRLNAVDLRNFFLDALPSFRPRRTVHRFGKAFKPSFELLHSHDTNSIFHFTHAANRTIVRPIQVPTQPPLDPVLDREAGQTSRKRKAQGGFQRWDRPLIYPESSLPIAALQPRTHRAIQIRRWICIISSLLDLRLLASPPMSAVLAHTPRIGNITKMRSDVVFSFATRDISR